MRAEQIIFESRGVTARAQGEEYINDIDPSDVLTFQDVIVLPQDTSEFETSEAMQAAVAQTIPNDAETIEDNSFNQGTKAALIAQLTDKSGKSQYHVRYIRAIPSAGVHTMWKTLRGYKYAQGAQKEMIPIKPSDLIKDENYRDAKSLANDVISGTVSQTTGTEYEPLAAIMKQAVNNALTGASTPIKGAGPYFNVLQKYAGEYLGPIALMNANSVTGDTSAIMQAFDLQSWSGSKVMFPQNTAMELIDSVIQIPDGRSIQVSSKISTSGGAASSLSGIFKQMTPEIQQKFPEACNIIELLATESAVNGPLKVAKLLGIIDQADVQAMAGLDKASKNIADLGTDRMQKLTQAQGTGKGSLERNDYRVFWHALTAVMNQVIPVVNAMEDFKLAMLEVLNNNQYVQLVTKGQQQGDDVSLSYFTKFPAVYAGSAQLVNKNYFATGQKGRIGFKLK